MLTAVAFVASFVPMLFYAAVLSCFSRHARPPLLLLAAAFLWGAIPAVALARALETLAHIPFLSLVEADLVESALTVPFIEEGCKAVVLVGLLLWRPKELNAPTAGLIYGGSIGLGFAAAENIPYFTLTYQEMGISGMIGQILLRVGFFGLNHAMYTGLIGTALALARGIPQRALQEGIRIAGVVLSVAAHGLHNALVVLSTQSGTGVPLLGAVILDWAGVLLLGGIAVGLLLLEGQRVRRYIERLTTLQIITPEEVPILQYPFLSGIVRLKALFSGDLTRWRQLGRYYWQVAKAAFVWHRCSMGDVSAEAARESLEKNLAELHHEIDAGGKLVKPLSPH
jgi:RsiW-degrading membrane proteinase PrsW (M82 family)